MRERILIVLCAALIGISGTVCLAGFQKRQEFREVAWWSLLYERPNPQRLPVRVEWKWAKGLD